ncbi:zinc-binding dehydrogenase [Phaeobacter gallaeciensis]|uniref:Zinc-binding dehydrogenase n=2 Tax=Roseobacteraceae TaxID=2854170 RepID=A0A366XFB6_9RHOB|nr:MULTISPECIES: alcohol dehydrogenase catalytic domain-containing protein [Roseobacteraceae]MBT3140547.1 alcohol dehydrogenase catalytic domain-containing protein [Falsiruegeria litorea]MBT8169742.1 alcohol dehydrogenase catalytic domain-containing protein [Falsiruegeria litorea]RBW62273.1 zinc-binding dehydrogenase [Phaeobacter gallaeciensis]
MSSVPETMFAVLQRHDGYSGKATGPAIADAADWLEGADIAVPAPGPGQVLIRLRMASVNPSDTHFIKGEYGQPRIKGAPAGFEGCGDVVATGKGADALMGQRVAFVASGSGAWAEYAMTEAMMCIPLRPDISDEDGSAQIVNPMTAMAMVDIARSEGDAFVVSAASSQLGKLMCALGRDMGLKPIALVRRTEAVETLKAHGAAEVLVTTDPEFLKQFSTLSAQMKPRVFLDAVSDQLSEQIFVAMPNRARWISYGKLDAEVPKLTQMGQLILMGKRIEGFWLTAWMRDTPPTDQARVAGEVQARFADGRWKTDVSVHVPLRDVVSDLADALKKPDGKVMITP